VRKTGLAALYTYFLRTTNVADFVCGLPVLNRRTASFKRTVGQFISAKPNRFCVGPDVNTVELLNLIGKELRQNYRYQRFPLSDINKQSGILKTGWQQLFDLTVSYEKFDYVAYFNGSPSEAVTLSNGYEQSALAIAVKEYHENQDIRVDVSYNLGAFDEAEIEYLKARLKFILEEMLRHPDIPLGDVDITPEEERHKLLVEWNRTSADYPEDTSIHHLFEKQVERTPDAVAVVFEEQQLTYQELNARANHLAHHLQPLGVGPEILVGICVERSLEMVVGLLGVLKAGGAYVPVDPEYPKERIAFMLEDSEVKIILTQEKLASELSEYNSDIICLDGKHRTWKENNNGNVISAVRPGNLAYVIYTSGSTGKPKGVMNIHRGLCNMAKALSRIFYVQPDSRILQFAPFSFDASVSEIFTTLCSGATLCLASKDNLMPGPALIQLLNKYAITNIILPPSALGVLPLEPLPALRTLIVAGEACPPELAAKWSENRCFINAYGPTESTVCASVAEYTGEIGKLPIGRPIDNIQLYILDEQLRPVPIGVQGELHIGGVGLARGYLNRPELIKEKFIPNPFNGVPESRLYKTGDAARYLHDGNIDFPGRLDYQVKIRGFRVELGEIGLSWGSGRSGFKRRTYQCRKSISKA